MNIRRYTHFKMVKSGVKYWAADYEDWGTMGMFNFEDKHGTPKESLNRQQEISELTY